jgi:hypothetical protein
MPPMQNLSCLWYKFCCGDEEVLIEGGNSGRLRRFLLVGLHFRVVINVFKFREQLLFKGYILE